MSTPLKRSGLNSGIHCLCKFSGFVQITSGPRICCESKNWTQVLQTANKSIIWEINNFLFSFLYMYIYLLKRVSVRVLFDQWKKAWFIYSAVKIWTKRTRIGRGNVLFNNKYRNPSTGIKISLNNIEIHFYN